MIVCNIAQIAGPMTKFQKSTTKENRVQLLWVLLALRSLQKHLQHAKRATNFQSKSHKQYFTQFYK